MRPCTSGAGSPLKLLPSSVTRSSLPHRDFMISEAASSYPPEKVRTEISAGPSGMRGPDFRSGSSDLVLPSSPAIWTTQRKTMNGEAPVEVVKNSEEWITAAEALRLLKPVYE